MWAKRLILHQNAAWGLWHSNCRLSIAKRNRPSGPDARGNAEMNRRIFIVLVTAFVIAVACSYAVFRLVGRSLAGTHGATTKIVAAAEDIKLGTVLKSSDLSTVEIAGALPEGAIVKPEDAIGRGVVSNLYKGEPILESRLATPGSGGGLAATIPQGMRAAAVKVNEVVGVAGFV